MATVHSKMTAARAFVRSLNILLKFVRMYGFDHARSAAQFETAWQELQEAIPSTELAGMLLGASGAKLLLDGAPLDSTAAERSFAQMLSAAGLASIQFLPAISREELAGFVRAFPSSRQNTSSLAEQLKVALAGAHGIKVNEVRFVAEDPANPSIRLASQLTAKSLGADADRLKNWLSDPQKLLQMIAAAEGSRGPGGVGQGGSGRESGGRGPGGGSGASASAGSGSGGARSGIGSGGSLSSSADSSGLAANHGAGDAVDAGTGAGSHHSTSSTGYSSGSLVDELVLGNNWTPPGASFPGVTGGEPSGSGGWQPTGNNENDEIFVILRLLSRLGQTSGDGAIEPGPFQQELSKLSGNSRDLLQKALSSIAAHTPAMQSNDPMLVRLAEHLAIRFALDRYERGELRVNAVRQMLDGMSEEIAQLRKILGGHEAALAEAGVAVESYADQMDRKFWASVPESGKRAVLTSPEAWCIPPRNVRQYVTELRRKGDHAAAAAILENYAAAVTNEDPTARRRVAIGLSDLADLFSFGNAAPLGAAIRRSGSQLAVEREPEIQGLIGAAFVRLAQEASANSCYPALLQALDSLDGIEHHRPTVAQSIQPRLGLDKRLPELLTEAVTGSEQPAGLLQLLQRMPRASADGLAARFNRASRRAEADRIVELTRTLGSEAAACLRDHLLAGQPAEAAEATALLCRIDVPAVERALRERLRDWPRIAQDRALRMVASSAAPERGWLLLAFYDLFDPLLRPLALDEIGMSGESAAADLLLRIATGDAGSTHSGFLQVKAIEALGRLRVANAADLLRSLAESKKYWRWTHHTELRVAAFHAARVIAPDWASDFLPGSGLTEADLDCGPSYARNSSRFRQRRYQRLRLREPLASTATSERETVPLEVRRLSLAGGLAHGDKHLAPGTLVSLRLGSGLRAIKAQAIMRDARGQGLSFEFVEMLLDERTRLREFLRHNCAILAPSSDDNPCASAPAESSAA